MGEAAAAPAPQRVDDESDECGDLRIMQAMSLGQGDEARDLLTQCLREHPGSARANYLMVVELAEAGDMGGALVRFAAALDAEPGLHEARLHWGMVLLMLGRTKKTMRTLEGFDSAPLHPVMNAFQIGLRCIAAGRLDAAARHFRVGLALGHPNAPLAEDLASLARYIETASGPEVGGSAQKQDCRDIAEFAAPTHFLVQAYGDACDA